MISSPLAVCSTEGHSPLQFDTSCSSPHSALYGLQSRGTVASQLAGLTVTSPSLVEAQQAGKAGCESPAESNSFKKTRRGKRAGKNLRLRNAESEFRRRSVDTMHSGDDSPRSWTPRSQVCSPPPLIYSVIVSRCLLVAALQPPSAAPPPPSAVLCTKRQAVTVCTASALP